LAGQGRKLGNWWKEGDGKKKKKPQLTNEGKAGFANVSVLITAELISDVLPNGRPLFSVSSPTALCRAFALLIRHCEAFR